MFLRLITARSKDVAKVWEVEVACFDSRSRANGQHVNCRKRKTSLVLKERIHCVTQDMKRSRNNRLNPAKLKLRSDPGNGFFFSLQCRTSTRHGRSTTRN